MTTTITVPVVDTREVTVVGSCITTLPKNLIYTPGTLFQDFETTSGWTCSAGTLADNVVEYWEGTQSLKLTTVVDGTAILYRTISNVLTGNMQIAVYLHDDPTIKSFQLQIASATDYSVRFQYSMTCIFPNAWHNFNIRTSDWTAIGAASWANTQVRLRILIGDTPVGESTSLSFDALYTDVVNLPAVMFGSSGSYIGLYNNAYPYAVLHNFVMDWYVCTGPVGGGAGYATWANLQTAQASGHTHICNHTKNHVDLTTLADQAAMEAEIQAAYDDLTANSLSTYEHYFLPPIGNYNATMRLAMVAKGITLAQVGGYTSITKFTILPTDLITTPRFEFLNDTITYADAQAELDSAILRKELISFVVDDLVAGTPSGPQWNYTDWCDLVNYAISHNVPIVSAYDVYRLSLGSISIPQAY
jgi:hypothetical protein